MEEKDAQVIIALSFGQGMEGAPGLSNEALARVVSGLREKYNLLLISQREIADCMPEITSNPQNLVVCESRKKGQYLDTAEVLAQAKIHCAKFGFTKAIIVAHPDHAPRVLLLSKKNGFDAVAADTRDVPYDPDSIQEWTRSRKSFSEWNEFAEKIFSKLEVPLNDTLAGGNVKTSITGAPFCRDLNDDGINDYVFIFSQESFAGKFYYLIAGVVDPITFAIAGTNEVYLGKDVVIREVAVKNNKITVKSLYGAREFAVEGKIIKEIYGG